MTMTYFDANSVEKDQDCLRSYEIKYEESKILLTQLKDKLKKNKKMFLKNPNNWFEVEKLVNFTKELQNIKDDKL